MITEVKERRVTVRGNVAYHATIKDGKITQLEYPWRAEYLHNLKSEHILIYIVFLKEVLQAMEETERK